MTKVQYRFMQGGGVPGGHNVIYGEGRNPFITPMRECASIPLRHSDVVVDIGAYVGTYAIRCARFPVKRVIAYEPTPQTFDILWLSKTPNMQIINAAIVGDDRESVDLFISAGIGVTNSIVNGNRKPERITVPAINYADAVKGASIVKIDVEGAEYDYPIIQPSLRAVILDFHPMPDWIDKARQIMSDLEAAGFSAVITPDFDNGWTRAGSWIRDMDTQGEFHPMMNGEMCCGCGRRIKAPTKGLCKACWEAWIPKHRVGFSRSIS